MMRTARLLLIPASPAALRAELDSPAALADTLGVDVPPSWPPDLYDADAVRWTLNWLEENPEAREWGFYYIAESSALGGDRPRLVGAGGYKGAPDATGAVEIGYSILAERRRRGYAREAVAAWLARAFADSRVTRVVAHTLPHLAPSIGVLRSTGFELVGAGMDSQEPDAIRFELPRARYAHAMATALSR
jgi:RimJ/RimL family protein N-acetyltransferase